MLAGTHVSPPPDSTASSGRSSTPLRKALGYFPNIRVFDYGETTTPELYALCLSYRLKTNGITGQLTPTQMR